MRILLVRHGETEWNKTRRFQGQTDVPLNDHGRAQARALAKRLAPIEFSHVVSSDLSRARETAEIITAGRGLTLTQDPDWRELALGDLEGLYADEVIAQHPEVMKIWKRAPQEVTMPGGEALGPMQERVWSAFERLPALEEGQTALVVAHGFALISLLCRVLSIELAAFRHLWLDSTGISELERTSERTIVRRINDTAHLEKGV